MSTQIAVRLPDDLLAQLDQQVRDGAARSRTELIRTLLERALRRAAIEAERAALAQHGDDPDDLAGLAAWAGQRPLPLGD
jgi:antitoxin MazE3